MEKRPDVPHAKRPGVPHAPWLLAGFWTAGPWSLVWLGLVAADGLTGGGIVGPGPALGLFSAAAASAAVILRPWDEHGRAAAAVAPPGPFPRLGGLKGNREVAVGLGVVAVILAWATVAGDGPLHGPTMLGLWGVLTGCACLYGLLALRPPGRVPFAWVPVAPAAAPEEPVRRDVESFLRDLSASGFYRGRMAWHLTLPASEALVASDRRVRSCLGPAMPGLYLHQARAWDLLAEGENVLMAAPLGAGKSTLAALYAVERVLGSGRTVLSVCPDPDAARRIGGAFARVLREAEVDWALEVETLATVGDARRYLEEPSRPVPDMAVVTAEVLHEAVLPRAQRWEPLLRNTGLVVVEDIHLYDPVGRQHAACTLRRLWRALDRLEVTPQVLVTSADSADPRRFARDLTGLDLKARAVVATDARSRPAVHIVYWQPETAGEGEDEPGGAQAVSVDRTAGPGAGHPLGVTPHPVCDLMARAVLAGFAVALVTHPDWLSPALAGTIEAEALRLGRELARESYLRERDRLAADIEATFGAFVRELDEGLAETERSLREEGEPDEHVTRDLLRAAQDVAAVLRSVARETMALFGTPPLRDHGDAERRLRALASLQERLENLGGFSPRLEGLVHLKQRLASLLSSSAVEGLATALRVFAEKMASLEKARIQVCATLEASPSPTGPTHAGPDGPDRPLSAAEAFDFMVIMGAPAPHFIIAHQLAHLGQGRTHAPSDALVVLVPTAEPVSRWLERHPGALMETGQSVAFPAALGDRHVLPLHLGCALSEAGVASTDLAEAEAQQAFGEAGLTAFDELGTRPLSAGPSVDQPANTQAAPRRSGGPTFSFAVADPPGTVFADPLNPGREV
ncbi:MAG: DEAD/DEAH box helicase, partial [Firmicutes bacterium]|nr:DEAD/DEAH box helicase [Bacillota bacterium]